MSSYLRKIFPYFLPLLNLFLLSILLVFGAFQEGHANEQGSSSITIGVGFIHNNLDHTSDSFSLAWYLHKHPITVNGSEVQIRLVDHSSEADYSVSGKIEGDVSYTFGSMPHPHQYSWRQEGSFKLHARGRKVKNLYFNSMGSIEESQVVLSIRARALQDVWKQLAEHLQQRITQDRQNAGSSR